MTFTEKIGWNVGPAANQQTLTCSTTARASSQQRQADDIRLLVLLAGRQSYPR